jgi:polyisoprenoid-binding protein YceI
METLRSRPRALRKPAPHYDRTPHPAKERSVPRTSRLAATCALLAASAAHAQPHTTHLAADVRPGHYVVEPAHTQILFAVDHLGFTTYYGSFANASGTLDLAADAAADRLAISVPMGSVSTTSSRLVSELVGTDWLDATKFPDARFTSTAITRTGDATADITGDFTLHGVTHPLTLHARFVGAGVNPLDQAYTVGFSATGSFHRSEYGVAKYVPLVGDEVSLTLSGAFERKN